MRIPTKRLTSILFFVAASLLISISANADIQKWVDREGNVHYGDRAPSWAEASSVVVRPNVIETDPVAASASTAKRPPISYKRTSRVSQRQERKDIEAYIEHCQENRGVYCEWEAHAMIDGPATVLFPGDPFILPRPDLRPPPPPQARPVPERL